MSLSSSPLSSARSDLSDVEIPDLKDQIKAAFYNPPSQPSILMSPTPSEREDSPPHHELLADNPDIAFLVMFRARFSEAFPAKLMHLGPQDIESGIVEDPPSDAIEDLLCSLLGLFLNRKKPVERGHYNRALEDALSSKRSEWPPEWNGTNPISGTKSFNTMTPTDRLSLLRSLVIWSLTGSDAISNIIKDSYKQNRHDTDINQPLSVQPWGFDGRKRRYWLIEGQDDTCFRLYCETGLRNANNKWRSVGGTIEELRQIANQLSEDGSQAGKRLSTKIINSLTRFEATEEKRKRREYRLARKLQFSRPDPGFSLYEGRTRGKRMKYTYSDDEENDRESSNLDAPDLRRSHREKGTNLNSELGPATTASGRQVRTRYGNMFGTHSRDSPATDGFYRSEDSAEPSANGRSLRTRDTTNQLRNGDGHWNDQDTPSEEEWQGGDEDEDEADIEYEVSDTSDQDLEPKSLVISLKYGKAKTSLQQTSPQTVQSDQEVQPISERIKAPLDKPVSPLMVSSIPPIQQLSPTYKQKIQKQSHTSTTIPSTPPAEQNDLPTIANALGEVSHPPNKDAKLPLPLFSDFRYNGGNL